MPDKSRFMALPGEMRNQIYEEYAGIMTLQVRNGIAIPPPLARVCKKIRQELMSLLHRCLFHTAPLEIRVIDWNFVPVVDFIRRLRAHSNGTTRKIKIFINVYTPDSNYSLKRLLWCMEASFADAWYREVPQREINLINNPATPVRVSIAGQSFDINHIVRFPPSRFSIESRMANEWQYQEFSQAYRRRSRTAALSHQLERSLVSASRAQVFVRDYWDRCAAWNERLGRVREKAQYRQKLELSMRLGLPSMLQLYPGGSIQDRVFTIRR